MREENDKSCPITTQGFLHRGKIDSEVSPLLLQI